MKIKTEAGERHVLAITVDNEAGVLAKITGLFTARGYNIESLTVADINPAMLEVGRRRARRHGLAEAVDFVAADAEKLPVASGSLDAYTVAFGLRTQLRGFASTCCLSTTKAVG